MITRAQIESALRLHVLNLCLAAVGKQEGTITLAMKGLHDQVETMIREAAQGR